MDNDNQQKIQIKQNNVNFIKFENKQKPLQKHKFLQSSFISLMVGQPGSGKTQLLIQLLNHPKLYKGFFDRVYIFSPYEIDNMECELGKNYFNDFSIENIFELIENIKQFKIKLKSVLFIIDDFIATLNQKKNERKIKELFFNRRHLIDDCEISFIVTTQKYIQFPSTIRACITSLFLFNLHKADIKQIKYDIGIDNNEYIFEKLVQLLKQCKYQFIMYYTDTQQYFYNFDEISVNENI